jgi:SanA protein
VALYKAGKIQYVLISGDNSRKEYSEPEMMQADLIAAGIPAERIFLDFAGFRTLDSIVRCKLVFGEDDILIISQPFHNERALFIADKKDIKAVAYNAQDVSANYGFKTQMREKLARIKLLLDIAFDKQPEFLGEQVRIQ